MNKFIEESWLVLAMGIAFAILLAGTQTSLSARITENQQAALKNAIAEVVPGTENAEKLTIEGNTAFRCTDADGKLIGWAVQGSGTGFVDKIKLVVGLTANGETVLGIKVIENLETPGLGNKIEGAEWAGQFDDLNSAQLFRVVKGGKSTDHDIQAITGATYSSVYVADIVNDICQRVRVALPTE